MKKMTIHIRNLRLRTIIGVEDWERERIQDIVVNVKMTFDGSPAAAGDDLAGTVDYTAVKRRIMDEVERSSYRLIESLAGRILEIVMEDSKVLEAWVEIDKPHALRFADSVSVSCSSKREA